MTASRRLRSVAGLAAILLAPACGDRSRPNVLLVTFDTTRADALGCYGNPHRPSPNLDRLADEGVLFEDAMTAIPITTPSHSTILTGLYPTAHGVRDNGRFVLADSQVTLAERLRDAGYSTGAAIGGFPLVRKWHLDQGFDFYDDRIDEAPDEDGGRPIGSRGLYFEERPATRVNDAALRFLRAEAREPFFLWVHYWDAHQPYLAPKPFSDRFAQNGYEAEIAFADDAFGSLLAELERTGRSGRTVVVALADHGEGMGEHGEDTHSMLLYQGTLHVPLIVRAPGLPRGERVAEPVGTVDVAPTILDLVGQPVPSGLHGRSLVRVATSPGEGSGRRPYYSETLSPRFSYGWGEQRSLRLGPWKLLYGPRTELYDLATDPHEVDDRAPNDQSREMTESLTAFLDKHASASAAEAARGADPETTARLAALGYLSAAGGDVEVVETLRRDGDPPQIHVPMVSLWSKCKAELQRGEYLEAREKARLLVAHEPTNLFYLALEAQAELGLGRLDASAAILRAHPVGRQNEGVALLVAIQLVGAGRTDEASALFDRVVAEQPSAPSLYLRGELAGALGDSAGKERDLVAALDLEPNHRRARQSLAVLYAETGRDELAETEFRRLRDEQPLDASAHFNLGNFLRERDRLEEAEIELDRAVELEPEHWKARLARALIWRRQGRDEAAGAEAARVEEGATNPALREQARAARDAS